MMQILLIEDDLRLSKYLSDALSREGHSVDVCSTVLECDTYLVSIQNIPQAIILDRMLGRDDTASLLPKLKNRYPEAGILVLSSLDLPSEKARLIDAGVDDYLSKPFSLEELSARLRLVCRRASQGKGDSSVRLLGNLQLDLRNQTAAVQSTKLDLTRKEFQLLSLLMDHPGRVLNRFQILDRVWDIERSVESNVVETTIKNIRKKLEEAGSTAHIESKRNLGYWIEA